jgi:hypothetical protein
MAAPEADSAGPVPAPTVEDAGPARDLSGADACSACENGDRCCPAGCTSAGDDDCAAPNRMFVTSVEYDGNLGGLAGADARCRERAQAAGLTPTFIALLATSTVSLFDRLGEAQGWVRLDGKPFAGTVDDLIAGTLLYPAVTDEFGKNAGVSYSAFTGFYPDSTCRDWRSNAAADRSSGGLCASTGSQWHSYFIDPCDKKSRLLCFEALRKARVRAERPPAFRVAFLSEGTFTPGAGLTGADAVCAREARAAGLAGSFRALLATTRASAMSRFDLDGAPWVRPDGVSVVATAGDLAAGKLLAPPTLLASGVHPGGTSVWTGAPNPAVPGGEETCSDWKSQVAEDPGLFGYADSLNFWFTSNMRESCAEGHRVYCFQD